MNKFRNIVLTIIALSVSVSCDSFLEPSVDQEILADGAVKSVGDLNSIVLGIHDRMNSVNIYGRDMYVSGDVMSDNAWANGATNRFINQANFDYIPTNGFATNFWATSYQAIANANLAINADIASTPAVDYAKGQAYALRALNHFNVLLYYGQQYVGTGGGSALGVPYVVTYAQPGELYPSRKTVSEVYDLLVADLEQAATLMSAAIATTPSLDANVEMMNYYAVKGLQSRVYLFKGDYAAAIAAADVVINSGKFTLLDQANYFNAWTSGTGPSSLFEVAFTSADRLTIDNIARIYRATNYGDVEVTPDLYNAYSAGDVRRTLIAEAPAGRYRMVNKYVSEVGEDNVRVIRYAEVLLNKAEALAKSNGQAAALVIINDLNTRRGGPGAYTTGNVTEVLAERRLELALEGQRLFDLARNGLSINVSEGGRVITGGLTTLPFGDYRFAIPIPQAEIDANSNMVQNEGYNN